MAIMATIHQVTADGRRRGGFPCGSRSLGRRLDLNGTTFAKGLGRGSIGPAAMPQAAHTFPPSTTLAPQCSQIVRGAPFQSL